MKKRLGILIVFLTFVGVGMPWALQAQRPDPTQGLFYCQLNKSETLSVNLVEVEGQTYLRMEIVHFTGNINGKIEVRVNQMVRYGHTTMITADQGRSGYLFVRAQENIKPLADGSTVLIHLDNNLFNADPSVLFTKGELQLLPMCHKGSL